MSSSYIVSIDQSTSASKVYLLDEHGNIVARHSESHKQYYPQSGYVEHDADEIWRNVLTGIHAVASNVENIQGIAISNQRETVVFWDPKTGKPVCPAIVWQDVRGEYICDELSAYKDQVKESTGLALSAYFPAAKIAAKFREDPSLLKRAQLNELCVGTVDSYLIYRLTNGKTFACDVSNASRTQLMYLKDLTFSENICKLFNIPINCLPEIKCSDDTFGWADTDGLPSVPITGVMGDSHASFFAQNCRDKGMVKATFGTGSSVMMNIGNSPLISKNGLSTSVGYAFKGDLCYVLEGNITSSGDTLKWLIDEAKLINSLDEIDEICSKTKDSEGVYLVPAFSGLGAPYHKPLARAIICGLNRSSTKSHIVRAALESIAYQDVDVLEAMEQDTCIAIKELCVDGGPTSNKELMQFFANISACKIQCTTQSELSALGAGIMAGMALGIYKEHDYIKKGACFIPKKQAKWRKDKLLGWKTAVKRSTIK